ncbi:MAG: hypothetical protein ACPGJI_02965, partial [Kangiellaceae bacterium]
MKKHFINSSLRLNFTQFKVKKIFIFLTMFVVNGCSLFQIGDSELSKNPNESLTQEERENLKKPVYLQDLAYGDILYDYYRGNELNALTKILIAQKQNALPNHKNRAELLAGAIYLNFGMLNTAKAIFDQLLTE